MDYKELKDKQGKELNDFLTSIASLLLVENKLKTDASL